MIYSRKQTLSEKAEALLWNGQEYHNYPDISQPANKHETLQWRHIDGLAHPEVGLTILAANKGTSSYWLLIKVRHLTRC